MLVPVPEYYGWKLAVVAILLGFLLFLALRWRRRRRLAQRQIWPAHAALSIAIVAAFLLLLESLFYVFYDETDTVSMSNTSRRWFHRHARPNNVGYRDVQGFALLPRPGVFRIGIIGDSITFGHGIKNIEDRFGDRLRLRLDKAAPGKFQIYNLGICGADVPDHLKSLQSLARSRSQFHMILLAYDMNDGGLLMPEEERMYSQFWEREPKSWLLRDTYLPNFLYCRWLLRTVPEASDYNSWIGRSFEEPTWSEHRAQLEQIIAACNLIGAELRVVTWPLVQYLGPDYPLRDAHRKLTVFWNDRSVPTLDLLPFLEGRSTQELQVNRFDGHPSVLAHDIAARDLRRTVGESPGRSRCNFARCRRIDRCE